MMTKESLLKRCKAYEDSAREGYIIGYPKKKQKKIARIASAIIKVMCEEDELTPFIAENAMRMAKEILDTEMKHDIIS